MNEARPFVKWAGGKRSLVPQLLEHLPKNFGAYYEPFVGGGAFFFALKARGRGSRFVLGDSNRELMTTYRVIKNNPIDLIRRLKGMKNRKKFFLEVRAIDPRDIPNIPGKHEATAARFIYLNKTCFNGLHRVNRDGHFNVPFGDYANPIICDDDNIVACHQTLKGTALLCTTFDRTVRSAVDGDLVYFDPPYLPRSESSDFTRYTATGFGRAQHEHLRDVALDLKRRGVNVIISNSDVPEIRRLYAKKLGFKITEVMGARSIHADGSKRGAVADLIIR